MKRVVDVIADKLAENGVEHVFMVTGGAAMHLNDAFGRHSDLNPVFCHHEQACAMAAESYGRLTNKLVALNVTAGPGGINALNGVFGAFVDSIAMVIVSGQAKRETMMRTYDLPLRQLGDQEVDIEAMVKGITKRVDVLSDPSDARFVVERAISIATSGRPGPVWIDVPIDVQSSHVDETQLRGFVVEGQPASDESLTESLSLVLDRLETSERPVVLAGTGVRASRAYESFLNVLDRLRIPVATAFNAHDLIWEDHPLYVGRPGTVGDRAGNFAVQNADFLLILGCRLNIRQVSYNWQSFAREAFKAMIDVDPAELSKPTLSIDLPIQADLSVALQLLETVGEFEPQPRHEKYLAWCRERRERYAIEREPSPVPLGRIDPYVFLRELSDNLADDDVVVTGDGTACVVTFQSVKIKRGQRLYSNSGAASMGYDLPAAIGAAIARNGKRVVCIAGDGSIMLNIQELQTIRGSDLPVKIIVINNNGYSSIRQTQSNFFPGAIVGCDPGSGLTFPDFSAVAEAFGIPSSRCAKPSETRSALEDLLNSVGPRMLEVIIDPDRPFAPKLSSRQLADGSMVSSPLEDMAPFLSREELSENMLVDPFEPGG